MVLKMNKPDVEKDNCTMLDEIKLMSHLSHENVIRYSLSPIFLVISSFPDTVKIRCKHGFDFVRANHPVFSFTDFLVFA